MLSFGTSLAHHCVMTVQNAWPAEDLALWRHYMKGARISTLGQGDQVLSDHVWQSMLFG
jgi:hypothetical protein